MPSLFFCLAVRLQSFRGSPASPGSALAGGDSPSGSKTVEAKYPALLFKQQLTAYVEKIYGMIRDNLKRDISPLLANCIQVSPGNNWKQNPPQTFACVLFLVFQPLGLPVNFA